MTIQNSGKTYWTYSLLLGFLLLAYRLFELIYQQPGFFFDEAYYYGWSLTPDWGYYSKPPMVAWVIWLTTHLFGVAEWSTKIGAPLLYLATGYIIQLTATEVANAKAGFWAFCFFILSPFVTLNSWFITTDAPLFFFWALTSFFFLRAQHTDRPIYWVLAGVFGGLGLMSKYTMILLPASIFMMYLFTKQPQKLLAWKFWVTIGTAALVFSPNVIWQFNNGFPSFIHTAELANKAGWDGNPIEFTVGQLIIFGPFALIISFWSWQSKYREQYPEIWYLSWVPLIVFALKSIQGEAFVNWAAFAYVSLSVLAGIVVAEGFKKLKITHFVFSIVIMIGFYNFHSVLQLFNIEPSNRNTPYSRVEGWREITLQVADLADNYPTAYVASNSRTINAYLSYYLEDSTSKIRTTNANQHIDDHYELFYTLTDEERPVLWITDRENSIPGELRPNAEFIALLQQPVYSDLTRQYWVYKVE